MEQSQFNPMEAKIKEVQDYFKNKILSGEFETTEILEHRLYLIVDSIYKFCIWIGNMNIPETVETYEHEFNFMHLGFSDNESIKLHKLLTPSVSKHRKEVLIAQKEEELEKLKNTL